VSAVLNCGVLTNVGEKQIGLQWTSCDSCLLIALFKQIADLLLGCGSLAFGTDF
jgi:hypothetical protein